MQWISEGSVPPTIESALALNQCYQEALQRLMNFFQDKRDNLHSKQVQARYSDIIIRLTVIPLTDTIFV